MSNRDLNELRGLLSEACAGQSPGAERTDCLDDARLAALAEGTLVEAERGTAVAHLAVCLRCRIGVASVARAMSDTSVSRETGARTSYHWTRALVPLGAAALLLLVIRAPGDRDGSAIHRSPTITAADTPVLIAPVGLVARPDSLVWATVQGADRYRVTLFDAAGAVLFERELRDTVVAIPDSIVLGPARTWLWKVEARTRQDRWSTSSLVEFRVPEHPPR